MALSPFRNATVSTVVYPGGTLLSQHLRGNSFSTLRKAGSVFGYRILQPAQLVAWQEEHPDNREWTALLRVRLRP